VPSMRTLDNKQPSSLMDLTSPRRLALIESKEVVEEGSRFCC